MADFLSYSMENWREQIRHDLAKYWWGPVVGAVIVVVGGCAEHWFYASINDCDDEPLPFTFAKDY
jgi:hypothetical protein